MDKFPLISIITITHNRSKLLPRCIESIQKQTYKNYEHIIVDAASSDDTEMVIKSFHDPKIKYIYSDINSVVNNHWIGVNASKGDFITSLDDDDEYLPTKLEKQINLINSLSLDYGMVYCWMTYYDNQSKKILGVHKPSLRGNVANEVVESPIVSGTPTFLIRRNVVIDDKGGYKEGIGLHSDWEYAARICQKWLVDFVPESLVNVYVNHGHKRASEKGYYSYKQIIKFHSYFLSEFKPVFDKYPKKKHLHLYNLSQASYYVNNWRNAIKYQCQLLRIDFSLKNLLLPIKVLYHKLF